MSLKLANFIVLADYCFMAFGVALLSYFVQCRREYVVQEPGQVDQVHQQEQLPARGSPHLLYTLLLP